MSLPWFQVGGVPDLLSSRIWAWPFFLSGYSQSSRWPEPRHPSSGPGMEVNLGLLTSAFLCFKIFHSWAVEFLNQSGVGEDIDRLIHVLLSGPSITNSSITKNLLISFDFHSHNFFRPMLGRETKHSVGTISKTDLHFSIRTGGMFAVGGEGCWVRTRTGFSHGHTWEGLSRVHQTWHAQISCFLEVSFKLW